MKYDFILAGGGLSGLSFCIELLKSAHFKEASILLIDKDKKDKNDRTWSFWATDEEDIPNITSKKWNIAKFYENDDQPIMIDMAPFQYQTIQGIDFYNYALKFIEKHKNVTRLQANILEVRADGKVITDQGKYQGEKVFKSYFNLEDLSADDSYSYLLQHFKGWFIETPEPAFDPDTLTLMDYRTDQIQDTRFFYVLPFSPTTALVEFTVFSKSYLKQEEYDAHLRDYIKNKLQIDQYEITETEYNAIPMTDTPFQCVHSPNLVYIGTTGAYIKPSSGYGFKRTLERNKKLVQYLEKSLDLKEKNLQSPFRFRLYDSILLHLMYHNKVSAKRIFSRMFRKNPDDTVLRFLDEKSSLLQDLKVILSCPQKMAFTRAFFRQLFCRI